MQVLFAIICFCKLNVQCILHPGGYFHGIKDLTFGVDIEQMRWMGILQVCYISLVLIS